MNKKEKEEKETNFNLGKKYIGFQKLMLTIDETTLVFIKIDVNIDTQHQFF